jgi:hypothetical protein
MPDDYELELVLGSSPKTTASMASDPDEHFSTMRMRTGTAMPGSVSPTLAWRQAACCSFMSYQIESALQRTWPSDNAPNKTLLPSALKVGFHIIDRLDSGDGDQIRLKGSLR